MYPIVPILMAFFFLKYSRIIVLEWARVSYPVVVSASLMVAVLMLTNLFIERNGDVFILIAKVLLGAIVYCSTGWVFFKTEVLSAIKTFQH